MKVVILGGYGVFGSRLAELLLRDGHQVWVAGRSIEKATTTAEALGGKPLQLDLRGDLSALEALAPQVLVDAAGPFQAYGEDPYRLVRYCIEHGIGYLDLSDDAAFTAGIAELDRAAKAAGCFALSGASSVPGISSSVVSALAGDLTAIDVIDTAIMPGNRAPRGRSVMSSILGQVGAPLRLWRGGQWRQIPCWSNRRVYRLDKGLRRAAWCIGVPDLFLFPKHFGAGSVLFRAGLELGSMNAGLRLLSILRSKGLMPAGRFLVPMAQFVARLLQSLGSDRGAMVVEVTGRKGDEALRRRWTLVAEAGEGPYIPTVAARALIRRAAKIAPGARACLAEAGLSEIEAAMADLTVRSERTESPCPSLFRAALNERWKALPASVRRLHSVQDMESFSGRAEVVRGSGLLARLAAFFFRFPRAGSNVAITVTKLRSDKGETWERDFAGRRFRSYLSASRPYHYKERFWAFDYEQELPVEQATLHLPVRRGWFLGLPIPRALLPRSESREFEIDGRFHFDVGLIAPLGGGLIVRYRGWLIPDAAEPGDPA